MDVKERIERLFPGLTVKYRVLQPNVIEMALKGVPRIHSPATVKLTDSELESLVATVLVAAAQSQGETERTREEV